MGVDNCVKYNLIPLFTFTKCSTECSYFFESISMNRFYCICILSLVFCDR
jgi:hypothetical protein